MITTVPHRTDAIRVSLPHNIVTRTFVAETVLLDVNTGRLFKLDRTAGSMLDALIAGRTVVAAAGALADSGWGAMSELVADLSALCTELAGMGLLRVESAA